MNSAWKASSRSQNASCRVPQTCGCRRHSNSGSGSNNCSFRTAIAFDGNGLVRIAVTAPAFSYLWPIEAGSEGLLDQTGACSNQVLSWLRHLDGLRADRDVNSA
jgi:hypothetical protein